MKTMYIPCGETVVYESLATDHLVVDGCLRVTNDVRANSITGHGVVIAGKVSADDIRVDEVEAASVVCRRLLVKRVETPELFASESAAASCCMAASYVETPRLIVAVSEIDEVKADEVIHLAAKKRSLFGLLFLAGLRSLLTALTARIKSIEVVGEEHTPEAGKASEKGTVREVNTESTDTKTPEQEEPVDEELNRVVNLFKLSRENGYTLRLIPGTPEQNAPRFDKDTGTIIRPAA